MSSSNNGLLNWPFEVQEQFLGHGVASHGLRPYEWHTRSANALARIVSHQNNFGLRLLRKGEFLEELLGSVGNHVGATREARRS